MYLGLDRRHLGPYHYQEKGFRYPIDEHDLRAPDATIKRG